MASDADFLAQAVDLAMANVLSGGRPFGAVVVKDGVVIATGVNEIGVTGDPTAHAELTAMRRAAQALGAPRLDGCVVYASGQPCPMCLAAMHMTGVRTVRFCYSNDDGEAFGLSTAAVYAQMAKPLEGQAIDIRHQSIARDGPSLYAAWKARQDG
ncbi:MAG: nucleoside deaminase [Phenylobacterium sp.]|uniref:nucleoside deaminase n=1 Tax=Phenylobacterium sp. TaxID=1871053 RepID=UPI0025D52FE4|nr:nucleoside deaminase [Phenylobacterium sp.]MBA4014349.1 nucleoside deaminase [Phenylobacterium sp.]